MRLSQASQREGRVVKAYQPENLDPLSVATGEELQVSERSDPWQGNPDWIWVWCTDPRGKSAWAPADLLEPMLRELERMVGSAEIERCLEESRVRRFH